MILAPIPILGWPKLAWVAYIVPGLDEVQVLHGPCVEVRGDWCAEGVWCGDFAVGDFDLTDRVFGTGVRIRGDQAVFVSSGTAMDRLWFRQSDGRLYVSNSLPALCACAGFSLVEDRRYDPYIRADWGAAKCTRMVPGYRGEIGVAWFNNLVYDGNELKEQGKPDTAPTFRCYQEYFDFLVDSARRVGENMRSPDRQFPVVPFGTISSGYDSPAVAVVAKHAGCQQAVTIEDSNSLWRGSDSGIAIAKNLGLSCRSYRRTARVYPNEVAIWAASGRANLLSWALFEYPQPVSAMFLANYGDAIWSRKPLRDPYTESIIMDLSMGECRLWVGTFLCVVPYWGMRHAREINAISFSEEMAPWTLNTTYDRPIPRRILEEAGVPRGTFAVRKKDTSHERPFPWPYSAEARKSFRHYLKARGHFAPPDWLVQITRGTAWLDGLFYRNITKRLGIKKRRRPWDMLAARSLLFQWANEELKQRYLQGLCNVQAQRQVPSEV
jgi:hypothetical protein